MKNFILTIFLSLTCLLNANAQNTSNSDDEGFGTIGLMYYGFDGFENYGVYYGGSVPNKVSFEMGVRHLFEKHGHFNMDIMLNYSFGLWSQDSNKLLLTINAGPSVRNYQEPTGNSIGGNDQYKDKYSVDGVFNPRITLKLGKISLTGGYFFWAPKFKFDKKNGAQNGFNVGLGYVIK